MNRLILILPALMVLAQLGIWLGLIPDPSLQRIAPEAMPLIARIERASWVALVVLGVVGGVIIALLLRRRGRLTPPSDIPAPEHKDGEKE